MVKKDLIKKIAEKTGATQPESEKFLEATLESIAGYLMDGEKVSLNGFGIFDVKETKARQGRNPKTGEAVSIPASKKPTFKFGKPIRDAVK